MSSRRIEKLRPQDLTQFKLIESWLKKGSFKRTKTNSDAISREMVLGKI